MSAKSKTETTGIIFALMGTALWGMFPVFVNRGAKTIPPLFFAACSALIASFGSFLYLLSKRRLFELKRRESYAPLIMITFCIVVIPYTMISPLFSLIILICYFNEQISVYKWIGVVIMMIGLYYSIRRPSVDPRLTKYSPEKILTLE